MSPRVGSPHRAYIYINRCQKEGLEKISQFVYVGRMKSVAQIVGLFGGPAALSKRAKKISPQMIANWKRRNSISKTHIGTLVALARKSDIDLEYADFFEARK